MLQSGECIRSRTLQGKKRASRKERRRGGEEERRRGGEEERRRGGEEERRRGGEEERRRGGEEEGGGEVEGNILQHLYSSDSLYDR